MKYTIKITSIIPPIDGNLEQYTQKIDAESLEQALIKYRESLIKNIEGHSCQASVFDENNMLLQENCQL